jgi:hypothetical protein
MAQIHISQIAGAGMVSSGLNWYPDVPTIQIIDVNPGAVNDITTIALCKQDPTQDLYFKAPVDVYRNNVLIGRKGEYIKTTRLDNGVLPFTLNEKDTNYPFAVLVYYKYTTDTIHIEQGEAVSTDVTTPSLPADCITLGVHIEPKQGDVYTPPVVEPVNYFRWRALTKAAGTYSDIVDFSQSKVYLTLTGNITIANPSTYLYGDFLPDGKTLMLCVRGSAYAITWGNNFVQTDNSLDFSSQTTKWNKVIITKNELSGKYEYCITDTVTA